MKLLLQYCCVIVYNFEVVYEHYIMTGCQTSKLDFIVLTWYIEPSNDFSAYRNSTHRRQPLCKAYSDD
jgi:hypothetical protein